MCNITPFGPCAESLLSPIFRLATKQVSCVRNKTYDEVRYFFDATVLVSKEHPNHSAWSVCSLIVVELKTT